MLVSGTVYDGIVWSVEATLEDTDFWSKVHTAVTDSFVFVAVKDSQSQGAPEPATVVDDAGVDEEEVVE